MPDGLAAKPTSQTDDICAHCEQDHDAHGYNDQEELSHGFLPLAEQREGRGLVQPEQARRPRNENGPPGWRASSDRTGSDRNTGGKRGL